MSEDIRTAGIILAGGQSSRFGQPKALLLWQGEPFIRHIAHTALVAGMKPVIVVTGAIQAEIQEALYDLDVKMIHNPDWQKGQSTSLQAGLRALPGDVQSALFLLTDQPQISAELINKIITAYQPGQTSIIVPRVNGQRANPVLFDRSTFPQLMALTGDVGGRAILPANQLTWVEWDQPGILMNINTPEDYQALIALEKAVK